MTTAAGVPISVQMAVKRYGSVAALRGVSLEVPAGRLTAVLGPSGCGKTTLLRAVAGFVTLDSGAVRFGADDVTALPPQQRGTAMVFQSYALWPHMTVFDNGAYGLRLKRVPRPEIEARVRAALALVEIGDVATIARRKPGALSGGQQQRVALARALVVEPRVLLLDEPLSNLDAKIRLRLRVEIRRLQRRVGITTIYVTHDQEEALAMLLAFLMPQAFPQLPVFASATREFYRWGLAGTVSGVVLVHLVGALVFAVWTMTAVFRAIDRSLEEAAWLKMTDSGFVVPKDKQGRIAQGFAIDPDTREAVRLPDVTVAPKFECGGACAVSTAGDYVRFAQMLLNRGTLDGVRVLAPKTVEYMTADHLGTAIGHGITNPGLGHGFGLGFAVRRAAGVADIAGSAGDYNWGGAYGTYFWVDPQEELVVVSMTQAPGPIRVHYRRLLRSLVLQAIAEPAKR